jgi:ADP-heptose:LPS heptosyltransferase
VNSGIVPETPSKSFAGRTRILIEIDGQIEETLSAEPVIRALRSKRFPGRNAEISVIARDAGLFRNHPAVDRIADRMTVGDTDNYGLHYKLAGNASQRSICLADRYAEQMGIDLDDHSPHIYLDSFDILRMQRFNIADSRRPKIVITAGSHDSSKLWDDAKWRELCEYLSGKSGADIIQLGPKGERFFGYGANLIGRLDAREAATMLKNSDLLLCVDNGYGCLAGAVGKASVLIANADDVSSALTNSSAIVVGDKHGASVQSRTLVKDIRIESVLEGITQLCRRERSRMKALSCA